MEILVFVKLYHWKTTKYSLHKATDELYKQLQDNIDKFVEVMLGKVKNGSRFLIPDRKLKIIYPNSDAEFKSNMIKFQEFLIKLKKIFTQNRNSDLINISEEILADVNQFLYKMSLKN